MTAPIPVNELLDRLDSVPRIALATLPTPLSVCSNLAAKLGGPPIWIKRDDLTGLALGGNKTRYLEYVLADAPARQADTLVVSSGNQSNHCRQVAAAAAFLQKKCVLLLWGSEPTELEGNLLLDALLGAELVFLDLLRTERGALGDGYGLEPQFALERPPRDRTLMNNAIAEALQVLRRQGRRPYCINTDAAPGLAVLGYVRCGLELVQQIEEQGIESPDVFVASGGATQAGLLLASELLGQPYQVRGIYYQGRSVSDRHERIASMATAAARLLGLNVLVSPNQVDSDADYATDHLFQDTERRWTPVVDMARAEGILLEPSYTGRAMLAIRDRIQAGRLLNNRPIVLLHSGGAPLLFPLAHQTLSSKHLLTRHQRSLRPIADGPHAKDV